MTKILTLVQDLPNKSTIEHLETLLKDAKSGNLQSIVYVTSYRGNFVDHGWSAFKRNKMRVLGEIEDLKADLLKK